MSSVKKRKLSRVDQKNYDEINAEANKFLITACILMLTGLFFGVIFMNISAAAIFIVLSSFPLMIGMYYKLRGEMEYGR